MKKSLDELLSMDSNEILEKMKAAYQEQKLTRGQSYVARGIEIFFFLIVLIADASLFTIVIAVAGIAYAIYRMIKPHADDAMMYEDFDTLVEGLENYKRYRNGEITVDIPEKKLKKLPENIEKLLPMLMERGKSAKFYKFSAFVPLLNMRSDEMTYYNHQGDPFMKLLEGTLFTAGLRDFSNEKLNLAEKTNEEE